MTIAGRNKTRLILVFFSILIFLLSIAALALIFTNNKLANHNNFNGTEKYYNEFQKIITSNTITKYNSYVVCITIALFPLMSSLFLLYIYFSFKKTYALEMSFFVVFIFSLSFESLRLFFPVYNFSNMLLENISSISKLVYFCRLTGFISLFVSSIFAAKIITRQISYVLFFIFFISFCITILMPVNNFHINALFISEIKYSYSYITTAVLLSIMSCINYVVVYITKNAKEYRQAAISSSAFITGHWLLLFTGSILTFILGVILFIGGIITFIRSIHNYHIWQL